MRVNPRPSGQDFAQFALQVAQNAPEMVGLQRGSLTRRLSGRFGPFYDVICPPPLSLACTASRLCGVCTQHPLKLMLSSWPRTLLRRPAARNRPCCPGTQVRGKPEPRLRRCHHESCSGRQHGAGQGAQRLVMSRTASSSHKQQGAGLCTTTPGIRRRLPAASQVGGDCRQLLRS